MNRIHSPLPPAVRKYATASLDGAVAELFDLRLFARIKPALERAGNFLYLMAQTIYRPNQIPHL